MRTCNYPNTIAVNTVMNANLTGKPMLLLNVFNYAFQVVFTGTPTGTFSLQGSNDQATELPTGYTPTHWSTITNTSFAVTAAGDFLWNMVDPGYNWVRLIYTDTSGGTSTAILTDSTFNSKGF